MQMSEGKTGNTVRVRGSQFLPKSLCLLQQSWKFPARMSVREEQPDPESFAPQDFLLKEVDFISYDLCGLGGLLPPNCNVQE